MQLSIVIVNYNVRYFLEQCLLSVVRATTNVEAEIFVVDNASSDGSVEMLQQKFPLVKRIANTQNVGFSKANNQAIEKCTGEYILLLNPDTVVAEDTFEKCIAFMKNHPQAGALGVRMIDGRGNFLPESKRGLPTPAVAFYKTFGLAKFFPKSKIFGRYHLGYLSEYETHEVDVLSGAFMLLRKKTLDETGSLDETFFMYGEDIDLSYRITKAGYKNYYFPDTTIIHYKGESTKKGSLNYVKVFYNAMLIFARKHFSSNQSGLFSMLIHFAIVFRGLLTLLAGAVASSYLFVIDFALSYTGIYFITGYWENNIKYHEHYYPNEFLFVVVPGYIFIWMVASFFSGAYDKPFRLANILRGMVLGTIAIAVLYAFIPDEWRFSRAIILLGAAWVGTQMIFSRMIYRLIKNQSVSGIDESEARTLVVGKTEAPRCENILRQLGNAHNINREDVLAGTPKTAAIYLSSEIVFCSADFSFSEIIAQISETGNRYGYKILNPGSDALIGSNSKNTAGDLYVAEKSYRLFSPQHQRSKRLFDVVAALVLLMLTPVLVFTAKNFTNIISNIFQVLWGNKTWVGFCTAKNLQQFTKAKQGVISPYQNMIGYQLTETEMEEAELSYARYYSLANDLHLLLRNFYRLGQ